MRSSAAPAGSIARPLEPLAQRRRARRRRAAAAGSDGRDLGEEIEVAAGLTEREEIAIAQTEERPAQDADERDGILRIGERAEQQRESRAPPPTRRTRRRR